ncbi:MAG: AAA family ATPase [Bacteroidota bacterium]
MISKVGIRNFKSLENLDLDCKRINLFIGKPNVGKSNILECLSLFGSLSTENIRLESIRNLFYDQDVRRLINIRVDDHRYLAGYDARTQTYNSYVIDSTYYETDNHQPSILESHSIDQDVNFFERLSSENTFEFVLSRDTVAENGHLVNKSVLEEPNFPKVKMYSYRELTADADTTKNHNSLSLMSPHGENIFHLLKDNKSLLQEVSDLFKDYGYSLIIDFVTNKAEIQKLVGNIGFKIPYSLVADTLKRVVFYIVAIRTNENCSILLEEPENHSFPPYIRDIAFEVINSKNQFFIATHSPYMLNTIVSEAKKEEVSINIVTYADFKTKVKTMTQEEISELSDYGVDLFFNLNVFQ